MRRTLLLLAAVTALTACSGTTSSDTPADTNPSDTDPSDTGAPSTSATTPQTSLDDQGQQVAAREDISAAGLDVVDVASNALPSDITSALTTNGGELADTGAWARRFGTNNLPVLNGAAVHLIEATLQITSDNDTWTRLDELQWIFATPTTRNDILDQLARDSGLDDWTMEETSSTVDSAECIVREYQSATASDEWALQGCQFPTFTDLVSIGVSHTTTSDELGELPFMDPSVVDVVADTGANVDQLLVAFGAPAGGSTSTLTMSLDATTPPGTDTSALLSAGALAAWNRSDGEAGSAVFAGAPGSYWTTAGTDLRFSNEGRLAP